MRNKDAIHFAWQAQYLLSLKGALLAPCIGNDVSYVTQITDDIDFVWQAQYLVRLEGDFSWQAQQFVTFWEIAGARNFVFFNTKSSPRWDE